MESEMIGDTALNALPVLDPARAVLYTRISSHEQRAGFGLEAQAAVCRAFAERAGLTIAATCSDAAVSGTVMLDQRPGLSEVLTAVYQYGAGTVLLAARDRLARSPYVAGDAERTFTEAGVRLVYADGGNGDDASALLMNDIGHAISAHERRVLIARMRAGAIAKNARYPRSRAQGGKVPYGLKRTPTGLAVDEPAAAHVRRMFELTRGRRSLRQVAAMLTAETGKPWQASTIGGIIGREIYKQATGRIVDPRIWNAANLAISRRRKH
jgi:DNA invertase Pin-like site-specific DNA recombinase